MTTKTTCATQSHHHYFRKMPSACCIGGCNRTGSTHPNVSFFLFPDKLKRSETFNKWTEFVKLTRKGYVWKRTNRICSAHFLNADIDNCFHISEMKKTGVVVKPRLKTDAYPTIKAPVSEEEGLPPQPKKRKVRPRTAACRRREVERILIEEELPGTSSFPQVPKKLGEAVMKTEINVAYIYTKKRTVTVTMMMRIQITSLMKDHLMKNHSLIT
ncbi:uncharacterized protein [Antedon mediterranea]|uniref:uncharacterized protein n=1 Tax=Antedon mediterranea TaxID=105859 RepID=UPI003AF7F307